MNYKSVKANWNNWNKTDSKEVGVQSNVLRKSFFDTENFYGYNFTELRKEQYSR